ncbi:MAG: ATP-grasp domain-containing protein [Candidatus Bathyarchaeia archaeon]
MVTVKVQNLLVVGIDTVFVASSAKRAGYSVYAADYFGDVDLRRTCDDFEAVVKQEEGKSCGRIMQNFKPEAFLEMAERLKNRHDIDGILLSSGLEDYFDVLCGLNSLAPIIGNSPTAIRKVREKSKLFNELKALGIPCPETRVVKDPSEAEDAAAEIGYPVVIKPTKSLGGSDIRKALNHEDTIKFFSAASQACEGVVIQKFINGVHASISLLAGEKSVKMLSINEQLLGLPSVFQQEPFGYCGNIVPLKVPSSVFEKCKLIAEKIALHFNLRGSNGIDIVISESGEPYVVEVNPRFQGTLGCVERVFGINLVEAHIKACLYGELPEIHKPSKFCTRLILYAPKRVLAPDLTAFQEVWDIPLPNCITEEGEPLCSILAEGESRDSSFHKASSLAELVYSKLREV